MKCLMSYVNSLPNKSSEGSHFCNIVLSNFVLLEVRRSFFCCCSLPQKPKAHNFHKKCNGIFQKLNCEVCMAQLISCCTDQECKNDLLLNSFTFRTTNKTFRLKSSIFSSCLQRLHILQLGELLI